MKLCIASQGFTTPEIANEIVKLVGKPLSEINIAIVNEAPVGLPYNKSKRWLIKELSYIADYIGGNIDFVNFRAYDKKEIEKRFEFADIIYLVGGKQHVLANLFRRTNTVDLITQCAENKVVMGTSAGSMALCKQITSETFWRERYALDKNEVLKNPELGLVNFSIIPHYMREDHLKWDKDFLSKTLEDNDFPVYAITDNQAIIYNDGEIYFVGGEPEIFGRKQ
ncbi:MAG: peptidase E [Bacilli bacterium]|nr:peptidase E [Bacilli bacterium]